LSCAATGKKYSVGRYYRGTVPKYRGNAVQYLPTNTHFISAKIFVREKQFIDRVNKLEIFKLY